VGHVLRIPFGILILQYVSNGVMKLVFSSSSLWSHIW
jgi:hypothetical protein